MQKWLTTNLGEPALAHEQTRGERSRGEGTGRTQNALAIQLKGRRTRATWRGPARLREAERARWWPRRGNPEAATPRTRGQPDALAFWAGA